MKKWLTPLGTAVLIVVISTTDLILDRYTLFPETAPILSRFQQWMGIRQAVFERDPEDIDWVGHRGSGPKEKEFNENTEASIERSLGAGIRIIEIDLVLLKNGPVVLFHDQNTDRLLKDPVKNRGSLPDWETLRGLEWRRHPEGGAQEGRNRILSFQEFRLRFLSESATAKDVHWIFDLKSEGLRAELDREEDLPWDRITVMGTRQRIEEFAGSDYRMGYVAGWGEGSNAWDFLWDSAFLVDRCEDLRERMNLELLVLPATFLEPEVLDRVREKAPGIQIWTYLAESEPSWNRCLGLGVDGLIVDNVEAAGEAYSLGISGTPSQ